MKPKRPGFSGTHAGALVGGGAFLAFISLYVLPSYIERSNQYENLYHDAIHVIGKLEQGGARKKSQELAMGPTESQSASQEDSKEKPTTVAAAFLPRPPRPVKTVGPTSPKLALSASPREIEPIRLASSPANERDLPPFSLIEANGNTHLRFIENGTSRIRYRSNSVHAEVVDGVLQISAPSGEEIEVFGKNLDRIALSGNARVTLEGDIARQIHMDLSGASSARTHGRVLGLGANLSGKASLEIGGPMTESVSAILGGSSTLTTRGPVQQISLRASNGAQISLINLACQSASINLGGQCELKASGSVGTLSMSAAGKAKFACDGLTALNAGIAAIEDARVSLGHVDVLSADAKGNSAIQCHGKPKSISQHAEDSGSIRLTSA